MSRHQIHVATSHTVAHVATSNPCRDTVSDHSGISRPRCQTPGRDLPYCCPCRDLKNDVATSTQLSPISATSRRHFSCRDLPFCHTCRDLKMMSQHQAQPSQVVTSKPGRDQPLFPLQNALVATSKTLVATLNLLSPIQPGRDVHFLVATSCPTKPGRDLKSMSRPQ